LATPDTPKESDNLPLEEEEVSNNHEYLPISMLGTLYNNLSIVTKIVCCKIKVAKVARKKSPDVQG